MNAIALDTNFAIDILNGNKDIIHKVCGELLYGAILTE
jgi:predicted nucleic acid-binding protein